MVEHLAGIGSAHPGGELAHQNIQGFLNHLGADDGVVLALRVGQQALSDRGAARVAGVEHVDQHVAVEEVNGAHSSHPA